jgi:hypothetical protein
MRRGKKMRMKKLKETVKNFLGIQGTSGNWDYCEYMRGYYNGIELVAATIDGRNPEFKPSGESHVTTDEPCK